MRTYPATFLRDYRSGPHHHEWDQLTFAADGVLTVQTAAGTWIAPPHRAVWVPAGIEHVEGMSGPAAARSLYFVPGLARHMPKECRAVNVPPLLRELILSACGLGALDSRVPAQDRLIGVLLDQLDALPTVPLQLPSPHDARAMRVAELLENTPSLPDSLAEIARRTGASPRTIERLFRTETAMPFREWRQRLRLIHALRLLAREESVTSVALECGYGGTSAFIAMFKKVMGTTPSRYFSSG